MNNETFQQFKYRAINKYLIESLVSPSLYFARPKSLNDPFDCCIDIKTAITRAAAKAGTVERRKFLSSFANNEKFFDTWERVLGAVGVCSFSSTADETLLWSHYADEHRGLCIAYELPSSFIEAPEFQLTAGGAVNYQTKPLIDWLLTYSIHDRDAFIGELGLIYLKTKSPQWGYEKEVRLIRRCHGTYAIRGDFIKQVCFGLRTPKADIELIRNLTSHYCGCIKFAQMVRSESDFGLEMKPL